MPEKVIIGNAELWRGDSREILPQLGNFDLILTDPPYGIGGSGGAGKYGRIKWDGDKNRKWDDMTPPQWLMQLMLEKAEYLIIFGGNYFQLPPSRKYLIWDKGAGFKDRKFAECEMAWCSWDGNAQVLNRDPLACGDYVNKTHPTQKPLAVIEWALNMAPKKETICDPFMGSGTTGVAAWNFGKSFVGIERDPQYFEESCKRIERAQAEQKLFKELPVAPIQNQMTFAEGQDA